MSLNRHVAVIGWGAAGKTTRCRDVAAVLDVPLYDNDARITERDPQGRLSGAIIEEDGMDAFRDYERAALLSVLEQEPGINAAGGGIISKDLTRDVLKSSDVFVVLLDIDFDTALERAKADTDPLTNHRPVIENRELYNVRQPFFREVADFTIKAAQDIEQVNFEMIRAINEGAAH